MALTSTDLDLVDDAIRKIATGGMIQHLQLTDGRSIRHYDIDQLKELRQMIQEDIAASAATSDGQGGFNFVTFGSPR